ncbi:UDP-N-acetylmuramate--L-alanine ligase [Alkalibacter saccharofermentans]|uniref:UDP-N-acetylmuramate--L-alanine ligase n=1 Tax=Alkalibacter saccharofermentans DSM 14828 TaxID=1120975 RepID=A0A1M4YBN0_9FIRM|nr:UDP-N-acetylmuramate--L-alanine ligase [Alkalibacter saccharofermentans]SHF03224.1 UDP-N-acetylmuramate--L-alanine ligase [Alkalibacter saccharofermentans DSM 14828]
MKRELEKILSIHLDRVHFVGIGGSSMSGLASILIENGINATGSDMQSSSYTDKLLSSGAKVSIGHSAENIDDDCSLIVYTAAIDSENPELKKAQELGIPMLERSEFLGIMTEAFGKTIAVAGTHGKTTTSSLIASIFYLSGLDPTVSVGGVVPALQGNYRVGKSDYFVTEACEYVDSFLRSRHKIGIILNIELDHVDYFKNLDQVKDSFKKFASIIPKDGYLIANGDSKDILDICHALECTVVTTGLNENNEYQATNISYDANGKPSFDVYKKGVLLHRFTLSIPGEHNVMNSLAAIACADICGIPAKMLSESLKTFTGAGRRFEFRGRINDITVVEDYAHHPTELKVTIDACRNYDADRLIVVFQPHTFSRTHHFFDELTGALKDADYVIVSDIYAAREKNKWGIKNGELADALNKDHQTSAIHISDFDEISNHVTSMAKPGDFILVAGAGTINKVAYDIAEKLTKRFSENP